MEGWDWRDAASGACGALALTLAGTPFDVVKIRLQLGCIASERSALAVARSVVRNEGVLALWRGGGAAFASAVIENAVVFAARGGLTRSAVTALSTPAHELTFAWHAAIGAASGVLSATAICPAEVVKCRLQAARAAGAPTTAAAAVAALLATGGPRALFAGLTPLLARDVPFNALFFGSYRVTTAAASALLDTRPGDAPTPAVAFTCGGLAGMAAWSIVFPLDTIKSTMQGGTVGGEGARAVLRRLLMEGGSKRLYRGWAAAVARAFPANAALLWGVETARAALAAV